MKRKLLVFLGGILAIPHILMYKFSSQKIKDLIDSDVEKMNESLGYKDMTLAYYLLAWKPYRNLFYCRIGRKSRFVKWYLRPYPLFTIACKSIGKSAFVLNHPYGTILNCKSIGDNFNCCHLTTVGNSMHGRNDLLPTIGNNVSLGANVTILGNIIIGDNVIVGAGSVVVKDVQSNCVVAGNPAHVIREL